MPTFPLLRRFEDEPMTVNTPIAAAAPNKPPSIRDAHRVLSRHGKSFHWAVRFFDRTTANDVAALYRFCRYVDDIADRQQVALAYEKLVAIRTALDHSDGALPEVDAFLAMVRRREIDLRLPRLLVDAILADIGPVRMATWEDLVRYAYGVAATVGLMMCAVMGVRDPEARPFAVDLGIAMQLTNIARDVVEDARRDRRYLPGDWLGEELSPAAILEGQIGMRRRVVRARRRLLEQAARYYRSADRGMRFIPWRARLAVVTASRLYEAIGGRLLSGRVAWGHRAVVSRTGKAMRTFAALGCVLLVPTYWPAGRSPHHEAELHRALVGQPGVDGGLS